MFSGTSLPIMDGKGLAAIGVTLLVGTVIVFGLGAAVGSFAQKKHYENFLDTTEEVMAVMIATDKDDVELARELQTAKVENMVLTATIGELRTVSEIHQARAQMIERISVTKDAMIEALQEQNEVMSIKLETYALENE